MKRVMLVRPLRQASDVYVRGGLRATNTKVAGNTHPLPSPPYREGGGRGDYPAGQREEKKSSHVSLDELLAHVDKLQAAERKTVLAHLALKAQMQDDGELRDKDMWAQAVYSELLRAFGRGDGAGQGPALVKRAVSAPSAWLPVADFMREAGLRDLSVTERMSVYGLVAKLVVENALFIARKIGAPVSAKLVGSCSANVGSIFDNAFPGYLAAGLAPIVARQLTSARPG